MPSAADPLTQRGAWVETVRCREEKGLLWLYGHVTGATVKQGSGRECLKNRPQSCFMFDGNPQTVQLMGEQNSSKRQEETTSLSHHQITQHQSKKICKGSRKTNKLHNIKINNKNNKRPQKQKTHKAGQHLPKTKGKRQSNKILCPVKRSFKK